MANDAGGRDNISALLVRIDGPEGQAAPLHEADVPIVIDEDEEELPPPPPDVSSAVWPTSPQWQCREEQ